MNIMNDDYVVTNDTNSPEWEFYLTLTQARALLSAAHMILSSWQRKDDPTRRELAAQRNLNAAIERLSPQVSEVLYS